MIGYKFSRFSYTQPVVQLLGKKLYSEVPAQSVEVGAQCQKHPSRKDWYWCQIVSWISIDTSRENGTCIRYQMWLAVALCRFIWLHVKVYAINSVSHLKEVGNILYCYVGLHTMLYYTIKYNNLYKVSSYLIRIITFNIDK